MVTLQLLGGLTLEGPDGALTGPATQRKRLALLALLAVAPTQRLSREKLLAYLWPESAPGPARHQLSSALYEVRKAAGEQAILSAGEELRLNPAVIRTEVVDFESALEQGDHERAVALYRGPFLDGFFLSDAPEFERWVDGERERLAGCYARVLEALAEAAWDQGDFTGAAEWWKARAAHNLYDSRVALRLMQALESSGNRAGALQHAAVHEKLLREELGIELTPEVAALAERLRAGPAYPSPPLAGPPEQTPAAAGAVETLRAASADPQEEARVGERPARERTHAHAPAGSSWKRATGVAVALLALVLAGWVWVNGFGHKPAEIERVAVLPLANLTGDPQQDYFVAGMHDALVAELAQIGALTVYSRQSVLRYQGSELPLPVIARELGVDALVEGSVFRSGDSVRITVQLVRAQPEGHLWVASHYGPLSQALSLQGEVARAIARAIHARVAPEVEARLARARAVAPAAQQAYLRGLYHLERASHGQLVSTVDRLAEQRTAIGYLEEAAALDPEWAAAHAKLALAYHWLASGYGGEYEAEYYPKAKAAALRALALDETESQAHASLGFVLYRYEWDWAGAERAMRRAMELDPNSHHWIYALYLAAAGRLDEAITHFRMAEERNPLSEMLKMQSASIYACAGRHDEAIAQVRELQARMGGAALADVAGDAAGTPMVGFIARQYSLQGLHARAIAAMEEDVALTDSLPAAVSGLAFAYALAGRLTEARLLADRLEARAAGRVGEPAHLYAALGETERALDMVEAALDRNRGHFPHLRCTLTYRLLRDEPRMQALVRQVGFPR
jgi:DNA-binding SARP family transcriptional activator/TolB-like protein